MINKIQKFYVNGMKNISCKKLLINNIKQIPGVLTANIKLSKKEAIVVFDSSKTSEEDIIELITKQGYEAFTK